MSLLMCQGRKSFIISKYLMVKSIWNKDKKALLLFLYTEVYGSWVRWGHRVMLAYLHKCFFLQNKMFWVVYLTVSQVFDLQCNWECFRTERNIKGCLVFTILGQLENIRYNCFYIRQVIHIRSNILLLKYRYIVNHWYIVDIIM